jgi:hypothetical protein
MTLYVSSATFGANPEDYITLLLWGVASNAIGAQTINLKAMYDKTKKTNEAG